MLELLHPLSDRPDDLSVGRPGQVGYTLHTTCRVIIAPCRHVRCGKRCASSRHLQLATRSPPPDLLLPTSLSSPLPMSSLISPSRPPHSLQIPRSLPHVFPDLLSTSSQIQSSRLVRDPIPPSSRLRHARNPLVRRNGIARQPSTPGRVENCSITMSHPRLR